MRDISRKKPEEIFAILIKACQLVVYEQNFSQLPLTFWQDKFFEHFYIALAEAFSGSLQLKDLEKISQETKSLAQQEKIKALIQFTAETLETPTAYRTLNFYLINFLILYKRFSQAENLLAINDLFEQRGIDEFLFQEIVKAYLLPSQPATKRQKSPPSRG